MLHVNFGTANRIYNSIVYLVSAMFVEASVTSCDFIHTGGILHNSVRMYVGLISLDL